MSPDPLASSDLPQLNEMDIFDIIQDGMDKLDKYQTETKSVPAYTLSICE
jgi:hypothetical protein